jgi:ribosomal protein S18 acetylase RimI-like enzyme
MYQISSRIYEGKEDFQFIVDTLTIFRSAKHFGDFPQKTDLEEKLAVEKIRANTRLWFDNGQPIAWAYVDDFNNLHWEMDSQYTDQVGNEIVAWGEACIRKSGSINLDASSREDRVERIAFLKQHGFHQLEDTSVAMTRPLSEPIPEPKLPRDFVIRPIKGVEEAAAVATMHRAAFGTEYMTTENRLIIMNTSGYDPTLDLLAIAPNGQVAAYCSCSVNDQTRIGMTDPVATHPNYQRIGLARSLILTGMKLLKERGMESAHLGTSGDNIAMQKTAESVGFKTEHVTLWFTKEVLSLLNISN